MKSKSATAADWTTARSAMTVCTPQTGSVLPSTLVMTSGTDGNGVACTGTYNYVVNAADDRVVTGFSTGLQRMCRWCNAARASTTADVHLKDYAPPVMANRLISGITVWTADTAGA